MNGRKPTHSIHVKWFTGSNSLAQKKNGLFRLGQTDTFRNDL
ncbi:hypothetical protein LEP1GSC202_1715 [Leptospira yanagawae serovar Saopaulo str. Sao Paulo = ATCC 700523]|uniref:Uncharacterized protein n=1 Tax=Leptospira yanagawae serovar Saopaulo str. Sao Paulo = ATCC 700523 TaxID=1249483 RepID=A0A5E8HF66_9LEPT|nr:hypothetical protein LEP1GSC202_1715 [Leptospira yanagawae serovar Saopaulo str. Sao Paulo = ATCC 700523]